MKRSLLFPLLLICLPLASYSQFTLGGISMQGGLSYMPYKLDNEVYGDQHITMQNKPLFSSQLSAFAQYKLTLHSGLEAELGFLLQQAQQNLEFSGESEGWSNYISRMVYLTIPLRYTYTINNLSIMGGLQTGLLLHGWDKRDVAFYKPDSVEWSGTGKVSDFTRIDFGITLGVQQKISDRLLLTLTGYHSLISTLTEGSVGATAWNANVLAGIRYRIFPKAGLKGS